MRKTCIRHGPIWLAAVLVFLASCSGASHMQLDSGQTSPVATPASPVTGLYADLGEYGHYDQSAYVTDPLGLLSQSRNASSADIVSVRDMYENVDEMVKYLDSQRKLGIPGDQISLPVSLPRPTLKYQAWQQSMRNSRIVSATGDIQVTPVYVGGMNDYTRYDFIVQAAEMRPDTIRVSTEGSGEWWLGVGNWTAYRYQWWGDQAKATASISAPENGYYSQILDDMLKGAVASVRTASTTHGGFSAGGSQTVVLNDLAFAKNDRYVSSLATQGTIVIHVLADPQAVVTGLTIHLTHRDSATRARTNGYVMLGGSVVPEGNKAGSSVTSDNDGDETDVTANWTWENDGDDSNFTEFLQRNSTDIATRASSELSHVDNDANTLLMGPPPAGTNTWTYAGFSLSGLSAYTSAGTLELSLTAPAAPTTSCTNGTVTLDWDAPSQDVTGYQIHRAVDGGSFSLLTTVGDVTTYQDVLDSDYSYVEYKLKAYYTDAGNVSWYSEFTDPAGVNTLPVQWTNIDTITAAAATAFGQTATGPVAAANVNGELVLYRISNGAWVSANIATTDGIPSGIWVNGSKVGIIAQSQPSDNSAGLDVYMLPDYTDGATVNHSVVEYHDNSSGTAPGSWGSTTGFISPHPTVVYETGSDQKTLRFAQANTTTPDSDDDWNVNYVLSTAASAGITQINLGSISGKPIVLFHVGATESWIAASQVDNPASASDWDIYQLTDLNEGRSNLVVVQTIPVVVAAGGNAVRIVVGDTTPVDETDWTTLNFLHGNGLYDKARASVVEDAAGIQRLMVAYNKRDNSSSTTSTLYSAWCSTAVCSPDDNPSAWLYKTVGYSTSTDTTWSYAIASQGDSASLLVQLPSATPAQSVLYSTD